MIYVYYYTYSCSNARCGLCEFASTTHLRSMRWRPRFWFYYASNWNDRSPGFSISSSAISVHRTFSALLYVWDIYRESPPQPYTGSAGLTTILIIFANHYISSDFEWSHRAVSVCAYRQACVRAYYAEHRSAWEIISHENTSNNMVEYRACPKQTTARKTHSIANGRVKYNISCEARARDRRRQWHFHQIHTLVGMCVCVCADWITYQPIAIMLWSKMQWPLCRATSARLSGIVATAWPGHKQCRQRDRFILDARFHCCDPSLSVCVCSVWRNVKHFELLV